MLAIKGDVLGNGFSNLMFTGDNLKASTLCLCLQNVPGMPGFGQVGPLLSCGWMEGTYSPNTGKQT